MVKITVCIPMYKNLPSISARDIINFVYDACKQTLHEFDFVIVDGDYIDIARNNLADMAIKSKADYALWIDSDHTFNSADVFNFIDDYLLSKKMTESIVGAKYKSRTNQDKYVAYNFPMEDIPIMEFIPVDKIDNAKSYMRCEAVGMGFCIMPISILISLREKYHFVFRAKDEAGHIIGEDTYFFFNCKKENIKVYLDCSLKIGHVGGIV
jgi:hypothetical protein